MDDETPFSTNGSDDQEPSPFEEVPDALFTGEPVGNFDDLTLNAEAKARIPIQRRTKLTAQRAKSFSERKKKGYWFLLQHTRDEANQPMEALVQRVNFLDRETLGHLPRAISTKLLNLQIERVKRRGENPPELTPTNLVREMGKGRELADAYVCAGFLDPKVYMDQAQAELMGGVWVEDIDVSDRMVFMSVCEGSYEEALALLTPFSEESIEPPPPGEAEPEVSGAAPESDDPFADDTPLPELVLVNGGH